MRGEQACGHEHCARSNLAAARRRRAPACRMALVGDTQSPAWQGAAMGMGKFWIVTVHTPLPWSQLAVTGFFWIRLTMRITSARAWPHLG